ncbi:hypothetical protein AUEXF2481DRAFT_42971 [Aureobasidium subglaciale EXF-2481]|uniref:Uncharacterized protein n=1 Tax=Aureobasidium subglaciale (strain EXF-2481) TaxID=1043005 RepID=A0A074Z0A4_AURSE|nr:uncharacterized protein AUEXF2481DRAFT_42971 [Aureobasidium subglaciale EXF-2481]KEQ92526.1 hypothetical protein AUEXF2481DRAFT_42971 [Aureobasidium subglaciale EXF-2481]
MPSLLKVTLLTPLASIVALTTFAQLQARKSCSGVFSKPSRSDLLITTSTLLSTAVTLAHSQSQPLTARSMSTIDFNLSAIHSEVYTLAEAFGNVHIFSYVEPDGYSVSSTFQSSLPKSQLAFLRRMRLPTLVNPHRLCQAVRASWLYQSSPQSSHLSICYHHNFATLLARVQTIKPLLIQAKEHERAV